MNAAVASTEPQAGYALSFGVEGRTLEVMVRGEQPDMAVDAAHLVAQACSTVAERVRQTGCDALLLQLRIDGRATSTGAYRTAKSLDKLGFERSLRMAIVFEDTLSYRVNLLGIRLACHDGWNIAGFTDAATARAWLRTPRAG